MIALSDCLPDSLRLALEARYWAPIGDAARIEAVINDPALQADPARHPALFSDHGVVRGGERNAAVSAAEAVVVLVIEGPHYRAEWFRPFGLPALRNWLAARSVR